MRRSTRLRAAVGALAVVTAAAAAVLVGAGGAQAAPGDPFPVNPANVFIAQGSPTGLYTAVQGDGAIQFQPEGPTSAIGYNAIGYRQADGFIYGMEDVGTTLVRIGQDGVVTTVGTVAGLPNTAAAWNAGTFGEGPYADTLFVRVAGLGAAANIYAIDVTTLTATTIPLSPTPANTPDLVFLAGAIWAFPNGQTAYRIDPASGAVEEFATGLALTGSFGAQWVYGNGDIGLSDNNTGVISRIRIDDAAGTIPTFTLVSQQPGTANANSDGTSSPGSPIDLGIVKTGTATAAAGGPVAYTLTVTNNSSTESTGSLVRDEVPAELTGVTTGTTGCDVTGNAVECFHGPLAPGASFIVTVEATLAASATACFTNTATVLGNEADPAPANDEASAQTCPLLPALAIDKTSAAVSGAGAGDIVTYTVVATNVGDAPYPATAPAVVLDDLSGVLDDGQFSGDPTASAPGTLGFSAPILSWSGPLAIGASVVLRYQVQASDAGDGVLANVAWSPLDPAAATAPACDPRDSNGRDVVTGEPCARTSLALATTPPPPPPGGTPGGTPGGGASGTAAGGGGVTTELADSGSTAPPWGLALIPLVGGAAALLLPARRPTWATERRGRA
ncbi:DUF11 domain-containing protein [Leifsonia sp. F6_8S_P_1B]|uniref:DUF11 domain-containing protein n=1 Tax=Leifsonia williamsii TaxID=3035919 RepID=A0ABT8K623_9MICO|nr:DUF11 domain-containing protein [Leifsonia williamsii]MDN4612870.1 DUF11 domain-containing protein [Leifsonia williamsii]